MLLQSKKELVICAGLQAQDVFFYYTTTYVILIRISATIQSCHNSGWMMWNFLISGLSVGCTLVLYDGSPLRRPSLLWELVDRLGITVFGTSAKYIDQLSVLVHPSILTAHLTSNCRNLIILVNIMNWIHYGTYTQQGHHSHQIFMTTCTNISNPTSYWDPSLVRIN